MKFINMCILYVESVSNFWSKRGKRTWSSKTGFEEFLCLRETYSETPDN